MRVLLVAIPKTPGMSAHIADEEATSQMKIPGGASTERMRRIDLQRKSCLIGDAVGFPYRRKEKSGCMGTGRPRRRISTIVSDTPTLFCSGTFGNIGPNVAEIIAGFSKGVHVIFENAGHED